MKSFDTTQTRFARSTDTLDTPLDEGVVVLNTATGQVYQLNDTGSFVWRSLQAPASLAELQQQADEHFRGADDATTHIGAFVEQLVEQGLLVRLG